MLDYRIRTFLCVCRTMNFTKAAKELNLTQPAVSQHIKYIEEHYNTKLFDYTNKKLFLTPQGEFLKNAMETMTHDEKQIKTNIQSSGTLKNIQIGATMSIGEYYLPEKISKFMKNNPDINISVSVNDTENLLKEIDKGNLDFILCEGYFRKDTYEYRLIKKENIYCMCSPDYELPKKITGIQSLFDSQLMIREQGSGTRKIFENKLEEKGFKVTAFKQRCSFTSPSLIIKMLLDSRGISFLYESVGKEYLKENKLRIIDIPDFNLSHEFNILWKEGSIFKDLYNSYLKELID